MFKSDPRIHSLEWNPILAIISAGKGTKELLPGVYEVHHFGMWPFPVPSYHDTHSGVCDSADQLLEHYGALCEDGGSHYVAFLTPIVKADQPSHGGWRWHKWGEYIGKQKPTCEYMYDEPEIEKVYVYTIYHVTDL
jgi:hypothetical protein